MICTVCGTIHHPDDKHICEEADIPQKGQAKKPTTTNKTVV